MSKLLVLIIMVCLVVMNGCSKREDDAGGPKEKALFGKAVSTKADCASLCKISYDLAIKDINTIPKDSPDWTELTESAKDGYNKCLEACKKPLPGVNVVAKQVEPIKVRFQFSKDGAVASDTETGLTWARNANSAGRTMNWFQAMDWAQGLDIGGLKGWRLPNQEELETLAEAGGANPLEYFNSIGFSNVQAGNYWSSSTYESGQGLAWVVYMNGGYVNVYSKTFNYYVWPVRSGQ